jgi:hypothetical protein
MCYDIRYWKYASAIHAFFLASSKYEVYTLYDSNINIEESPYAALLSLLGLDIDDFYIWRSIEIVRFHLLENEIRIFGRFESY